MLARTQNTAQHVWTKPLTCQRATKMHFNLCWQTPNYCTENTKCISRSVDQTQPMQARTQKVSQLVHLKMHWAKASHAREDTKCIPTCIEQTPTMLGTAQNASQPAFTKTHLMPASTQNAYQLVLTKPISFQWAHKMHLNMFRLNPSHASKDIECI